MISLAAQAVPTGNTLPFRAEPVLGKMTIHARKGLKLFKRTLNLKESEVPVVYNDGKYTIGLEAVLETSWLFLK